MNNIFIRVMWVLFPFAGCKISTPKYYSFTVKRYSSTDSIKIPFSKSSFISYGDYLFEFKEMINTINHVYLTKEPESTSKYDTVGVYLLKVKDSMYYEFDTFAVNNGLIKSELLKNKKNGISSPLKSDSDVYEKVNYKLSNKDTLINNVKIFRSSIIYKKKNQVDDTLKMEYRLLKNNNFTSPYKIFGINYPDSNYSIAGIYVYNTKNHDCWLEEIDDMRYLTEEEIKICSIMIRKITDAKTK